MSHAILFKIKNICTYTFLLHIYPVRKYIKYIKSIFLCCIKHDITQKWNMANMMGRIKSSEIGEWVADRWTIIIQREYNNNKRCELSLFYIHDAYDIRDNTIEIGRQRTIVYLIKSSLFKWRFVSVIQSNWIFIRVSIWKFGWLVDVQLMKELSHQHSIHRHQSQSICHGI